MSLTLQQIASRLRSKRWQIPGFEKPINLWGADGKQLIPPALMTVLINQALIEWAMETKIDREDWAFTGIQAGVRRYAMPADSLIVNEAKIAYDSATGFTGYPLIIVSEPQLDGSLSNIGGSVALGSVVRQWNYRNYALSAGDEALLRTTGKQITYASLGADLSGNTPPATFQAAPFFMSLYAEVDRDLYVSANDATSFTIKGGALGPDAPFEIAFSFREITSSVGVSAEGNVGLPQRLFVWQDEFFLDPIPDTSYTLRLWGYHLPTALAANSDAPDPMSIYHESIFLKAKELLARELDVVNEGQILAQSQRVTERAKDFNRERHHATRFVKQGNEFWEI